MNLADRYRIYIFEHPVHQPAQTRWAVANALEYLGEGTNEQIRTEAGLLMGKGPLSERCVTDNMRIMIKAGLVKRERVPSKKPRGKPWVYSVVK